MAERDLIVKVVGDASSYTKALNQATQSTKAFGRQMRQVGAGRTPLDQFTNLQRVQAGIENLRRTETSLAAAVTQGVDAQNRADQARTRSVGSLAKLGAASIVAFNALQHIQEGLKTTGDAAFTTEGRVKNFAAALLSLDVVGGLQALTAQESRLAPDLEQAVKLLKQMGEEASRVSLKDVVGDTDKFQTSANQLTKDLVSIGIPIDEAKQKTAAWVQELQRAASTTVELGGTFETVFAGINAQLEETTKKAIAARKEGLDRLAQLPPGIGAAIAREEGPEGSESGLLKVLQQADANLAKRIDELRRDSGRDVSEKLEQLQRQRNGINDKIQEILKPDKVKIPRVDTSAADALGAAVRAQKDAFAKVLGFLDIRLDRARASRGFKDDLKLLDEVEAAVRAQIKVEGRTVELERRLFAIEQERARIAQERATNQKAAARAAEQSRQFRALGLSATGDKPIPTIDNLTKQLNQLDVKVTGGKNQAVLNAIRKVLTDPVNKATEETREAIRELFATIRGELDDGLKGPLTKTSGLNTKKILEGLGLDAATENEIRSRLSGFNSAGRALAPQGTTATTGGALVGDGRAIVVESHTTIQLDSDVVARAVTRAQQKGRRRNPQQKRGPNRIGA